MGLVWKMEPLPEGFPAGREWVTFVILRENMGTRQKESGDKAEGVGEQQSGQLHELGSGSPAGGTLSLPW